MTNYKNIKTVNTIKIPASTNKTKLISHFMQSRNTNLESKVKLIFRKSAIKGNNLQDIKIAAHVHTSLINISPITNYAK